MPESMKRPRDGLDDDSQSSARNTKPREEYPHYAHHESIREANPDRHSTSVPRIVIQSTSDAVLTPTIPMNLDESTSSDEEILGFECSDLSDSIEGDPTQQASSYSLQLAFEDDSLPGDGIIRILSATDQSFRKVEREVERVAEEQVKSSCAKSLVARELIFRHGSCTIFGEASYESVHPLTFPEDWRDLCTILSNYWTSGTHKRLSLKISRYYYALRTPAADEESFAITRGLQIHSLMKKADGRYYIPRTDLMSVTSLAAIRQIIMGDAFINNMGSEEKETFVQDVQKGARKLLALCVYARVNMRCLKKLLDRSLSDESLPLDNSHCCHPNCGAAFQDLLAKQGSFMAPVFNTLGEHKQLPSCSVLPMHFVSKIDENSTAGNPETVAEGFSPPGETEEQVVLRQKNLAFCGSGAYSNVYRVRIDPDHHRLSEDRDCLFALKEFKDRPQMDLKFEQERKSLTELRKFSFEHIVVHRATWTQNQKYYMLFPYAECNLREYMEQQQFGACTKKNILWLLGQFRNLADALRNIHNLTDAEQLPPSPNLASPNQELRKSAWHHDVKPQNILFFRGIGFKIADFGCSKVHTLRSGSAKTKSPNGTVTYEPLQAQFEGVISRPYDIWSLGCVFLELLLWAVLGFRSVETFMTERKGRSCPDSPTNVLVDDAFWQMKAGSPVLRLAVEDRLQLLKGTVLKQEGQPFKEVVELIPRMLDPKPQNRIVALNLWNTLDKIYKQKMVDLFVIHDDSLPKPADPDQNALPRLSLQAPNLATMAPFPGDTLPIHSYPIGDTYLSPVDTLSPRSGRHRRHSSLSDASPSSDRAHSPQSASASSMVNNAGSRRNSNVSNSNAYKADRR